MSDHKPVCLTAKNATGVIYCDFSDKIKDDIAKAQKAIAKARKAIAEHNIAKAQNAMAKYNVAKSRSMAKVDGRNALTMAIDNIQDAIDGINDAIVVISDAQNAIFASDVKVAIDKAQKAIDAGKVIKTLAEAQKNIDDINVSDPLMMEDKVRKAIGRIDRALSVINGAEIKNAIEKAKETALALFQETADEGLPAAQYNLALTHIKNYLDADENTFDDDSISDNNTHFVITILAFLTPVTILGATLISDIAFVIIATFALLVSIGLVTPLFHADPVAIGIDDDNHDTNPLPAAYFFIAFIPVTTLGAAFFFNLAPVAAIAIAVFSIIIGLYFAAPSVMTKSSPTGDIGADYADDIAELIEHLFEKSAKQGFADAHYCLGALYDVESHTEKFNFEAMKNQKFLNQSTVHKNKLDTVLTSEGEKYDSQHGPSKDRKNSNFDVNKRGKHNSLWHYYKAAIRGHTAAQRKIRENAYKGSSDAQKYLGEMYAYGKGVAKDLKEAYFWLSLAVENSKDKIKEKNEKELRKVERNLAFSYVKIEIEKAKNIESRKNAVKRWKDLERASWTKASESQRNLVQRNLAEMYRNGEGVIEDLYEAYVWFLVAESIRKNSQSRKQKSDFWFFVAWLIGDKDAQNAKEQIEDELTEAERRAAKKEADFRRKEIDKNLDADTQ